MDRPEITARLKMAVMQHFYFLGASVLEEFTLKTGRRVDVICLDQKQHITILEIKSSKEDFLTDTKWPEYLEWAHQIYFAVWEDFDVSILPQEAQCGILISDGFECHIARQAASQTLAAPRKNTLIQRLAHHAKDRASRPITSPH